MHGIAAYPKIEVSADGAGVVSHVGARLLADVASAAGLLEVFDGVAGGHRRRRSAHAPGRVLTDLAVLMADGGQAISDLAVLRHQPGLFGRVASTESSRVVVPVGPFRGGVLGIEQGFDRSFGLMHSAL